MKPPLSFEALGEAPSTVRGMGLVALSALSGTVANAMVRHLSDQMDPFEIAFFRALFGFLLLSTVFVRNGLAPLRTRRLGLYAVRGVLVAASILLFYKGLSLIPLAKATALNFSAPLFATVFAVVVLGETIRARRIAALAVGFVGTLVILRPGWGSLALGDVYVIAGALVFAFVTILLKILSRTESTVTMTLYAGLFMTPATLAAALPVWQTPTLVQLAWLVAVGAFSVLTQLLFVQGLRQAEVTAVTPVGFIRLIWAALVGYLVFAEVPDAWTWLGGIMIFASVTYIAWRERRLQGAKG
jgi:drug/metabolite transporter (DMT)-like permease